MRCQFLCLIYKKKKKNCTSSSQLIHKTKHQTPLSTTGDHHWWPKSCLTTRKCLLSAHHCKIPSDSMEKCWFSLNNCVQLSFFSLDSDYWLFRLETCWQKHLIRLFPPSNLLFSLHFSQSPEKSAHIVNIRQQLQVFFFFFFLNVMVQFTQLLNHNEGNSFAHTGACTISVGRIKLHS